MRRGYLAAIVLFTLGTGSFPFRRKDDTKVSELIGQGHLAFPKRVDAKIERS
jgi:hypothetical protein